MPEFILITGCSAGGKSTLLTALKSAGHAVVEEPGRRIVRDAMAAGEDAVLPWVDVVAFARRALEMARSDLAAHRAASGPVFFDRGAIDAASGLEHAAGVPLEETLGATRHYDDPVFLAPPGRNCSRATPNVGTILPNRSPNMSGWNGRSSA